MSCTDCSWSPADFCLSQPAEDAEVRLFELASMIYARACRSDFTAPGFCLVNLGNNLSSPAFRRMMVALERELGRIHQVTAGRELALMSAARFDQQVTTKLHRDGGPDQSLLMLGYEPSGVQAELLMADYARCACDMGLTPGEFLERHNPMFVAGEKLLADYTTRIACFSNLNCQIVFINNSITAHCVSDPAWQGVLHTARILNPDASLRRVVNSLMMASLPPGSPPGVSDQELNDFVRTNVTRRRGYDKQDLSDDV